MSDWLIVFAFCKIAMYTMLMVMIQIAFLTEVLEPAPVSRPMTIWLDVYIELLDCSPGKHYITLTFAFYVFLITLKETL